MDAIEFLKNYYRMCASYPTCSECKANEYCITAYIDSSNPEMLVKVVEEWAKENPVNTRKSEFLKHYPNAEIQGGFLSICPRQVDKSYPHCESYINCYACKEKYWLQEVE